MTSVCIDSNDACISILIFRINTADTVFAAWRSKAHDQCFFTAYRGARRPPHAVLYVSAEAITAI